MQLSVFYGATAHDVSHLALLDKTEITKDSTDSVSTATVVFHSELGEGARYGTARYGQARYAFRPKEWRVLELKDQSGTKQFAGVISKIDETITAEGFSEFRCSATDYGILLDRITVNLTYPAGWSDKDIIVDAFNGVTEVNVDPDDIAELVSDMGAFDAKDITLRELLENVCDLTGGEWRVDYEKNLKYYTAGTTAATFSLSDTPDGTTSFEHFINSRNSDSTKLANRVLVIGGYDEDGNEIQSIEQNLESQGRYGILSDKVVDRGLTSQSSVDLKAQAELSQRAFPLISGTLTCWKDGLEIGQTLTIRNSFYGLNTSFLIRTIKIKQVNKGDNGVDQDGQVYCIYEIEFGERVPDLVAALRRELQKPRQPSYEPIARPANGSITVENFASTIEPIRIVNTLPVLPDADYGDNSIVLLTTDRKLYRRSGNTWTRNVNAADIEDQLQAGQLAADSVIAGTIATGAIRAIDAVFDAGAIQTADIADASITNAKIVTLSASKLTAGTIDASIITVTNLNASNITVGTMSGTLLANGSVGDVKIASGLSASKVTTGTLDASVVNVINLNASNITTGTLSATRITSGTITIGGTTIDVAALGITVTTGGNSALLGGTGLTALLLAATSQISCGSVSLLGGTGNVNISGAYYKSGVAGITATVPGTFTNLFVSGGIITGWS